MNQVIVIEEAKRTQHQDALNQVYRLRHETFIDRLGWDISSNDGLEVDSFDSLNPHHIAIRNDDGDIAGCWRAMPTTGDYMLRSVFPELLQGEELPEAEDVWEISRFAVKKDKVDVAKGYSSHITIEMLSSLHHFAKEKGINHYVAVTTVGFERILRKLGVSVRRLGEGKVSQIGVEKTVAIWVEVNDRLKITLN